MQSTKRQIKCTCSLSSFNQNQNQQVVFTRACINNFLFILLTFFRLVFIHLLHLFLLVCLVLWLIAFGLLSSPIGMDPFRSDNWPSGCKTHEPEPSLKYQGFKVSDPDPKYGSINHLLVYRSIYYNFKYYIKIKKII